MSEESYQYFDLRSLLELPGLDIRKVSRNDMNLLTKDYFTLLSKFLSRADSAKENLSKLTQPQKEAHGFNLTNLESLRNLFEAIGCEKYFELAAEIVRLSKRGNKDYIAEQAKKLITNIDFFSNQLNSTIKSNVHSSAEGYDLTTLNKAIKLVEHEEAHKKPEILAVDDSLILLKTISSILNDSYKVYGMSDPKMMEDFLKQVTPDLFLLDYKMPDISGFELIPIIRNFDKHKDTPVIFLTSSNSSEDVATALKLGACDYIVKPFQGKQLREKIAKHIVKK